MKTRRLALIVLAATLAPIVSVGQTAKTAPVLVTNGANSPVPVVSQGTSQVIVSGTPSVTIAGTPSVNVNSLPSVTLAVRDVNKPRPKPFHHYFAPFDTGSGPGESSFVVPAGKEFVIEYFSLITGVPQDSGQTLSCALTTVVDGISGDYYFIPSPFGVAMGGGTYINHNQMVKIYADPATTVKLSCGKTGPGPGSVSAIISGYLIDAL